MIPLDRNPELREIGVLWNTLAYHWESSRVSTVRRVISLVGSLQICAGHDGDSKEENTETVTLHRHWQCFLSANIYLLLQCYTLPYPVFLIGGYEISLAKGTTQGDPIAMAIYVIASNTSVVDCFRNYNKLS